MFRIIWVPQGREERWDAGIGFVSHNWAWESGQDGGGTRIGFVLRIAGASRDAGTVPVRGLGSFRIFWFVDWGLGGNWVRFAFFGGVNPLRV